MGLLNHLTIRALLGGAKKWDGWVGQEDGCYGNTVTPLVVGMVGVCCGPVMVV